MAILHSYVKLLEGTLFDYLHSSVNVSAVRQLFGFADDYADICWSCSSWRELVIKVRYFVTEAQSPEVIEIGLDHRHSTSQIVTTHSSDSSDSSDSLILRALHLKLVSQGLNTIREVCARLTDGLAVMWCVGEKLKQSTQSTPQGPSIFSQKRSHGLRLFLFRLSRGIKSSAL